MSSHYIKDHSWGQHSQPSQSYAQTHLQLEQEFDFSALSSTDASARQSYGQSYQSIDPSMFNGTIAPSSTVQTLYSPNQQVHSRASSFGTSVTPHSGTLDGSYAHNVYGNSTPNQSTVALNTSTFMNQPGLDQSQNAYRYQFQQVPQSNLDDPGSGYGTPYRSQSPAPMQEGFSAGLFGQQDEPAGLEPGTSKQAAGDAAEGKTKAKSSGACLRCKTLKVRCEFRTETDPCKRCYTAKQDCVVPGRKKRRAPPKREHLLNEIRRQADEIKNLMAKLEALNINPRQGTSDIGTSSTLHSPVLSPSSPTASSVFLGDTDQLNGSKTGTESNKAVTEWLADVRGKFEAFDEYLGIVGAGMPRHYLVDEEDDDAGSSDGNSNMDEEEQNGDYDITVEPADPSGVQPSPNGATRTLRHTPSASSLDSNNTGRNPRKKISSGEKSALVPDPATPFGMFEHLNSKANRDREASVGPEGEDSIPGIANNEYFQASIKPGSVSKRLLEQHQPPHILARGLISPVEAEKLFQIYFDKMNLSVSLLDPVLYTAQRTYFRSPFLFTVICAIASRFYSERPGLYLEAMRYAQLAAGTALISGKKNVEMCQAYILMSLYPVPAKKWEDQRSWLYLGLAIRCATDLNLHIPNTAKPINETHAREMLNRTRVWLNCYNLDRSTGSQYGKPPIISNADYVANHSENWWQSSQYNLKHFDVHLCAYNAELKVLAGFLSKIYNNPNNPIGLNKDANFEQIATETDDELQQLGRKWFTLIEETDLSDPQNSFRTGLLRLAYSYARLSCLSFGFQHAFGKNHVRENPFLHRCLNAARDVVNAVVNDICRPSQLQYWRHGPEAQSVFVTFASAFLVKLLQPKFAAYLSQEERVEIRNLVQQVVDLLASPEIAIDDRHGPKLYSRFLSGLLAAPMAKIEPTTPAIPPGSSKFAQQTHSAQQSPQILKSALERTPTPELPSVPSVIGNGRNHTLVPPRGQSMSPTPTQDAVSFSIFAPQGQGVIDPYANIYQGSSTFDLNSYDPFFFPPLPGDSEMVDDMQALTDPNANRWAEGQEIQGFNWMTTFQRNFDLDMQASGVSVLYNNGNLNGTQKYAS